MGGLNTIYLTSNWIFQNSMRRCCSTGKDVFIYQGNRFAEDLIFNQKKKSAILVIKVKSLQHFDFFSFLDVFALEIKAQRKV